MTQQDTLANDTQLTTMIDGQLAQMTTEQLHTNQLLGRIQAAHALGSMIEALTLSQLQAIKADKQYKHLKGQTLLVEGKEYDLGTWAGFCKSIGSSCETIDLRLKDLQIFGEQALENAQALGMTTRELRKLRQLPDDDRAVMIGELEANVGDKEAIVDLIDDMSVKHAKAKDALQAQLDEEKAEREASDKVITAKDKKINELSKQLARQDSVTPFDRAKDYATEMATLDVDMMQVFAKIDQCFAHISGDAELPAILRVNQGQLLLALKAHADHLIDQYGLGDISVDDEQMDWVTAAGNAQADGEIPDYMKSDNKVDA